MTSIVVNAGVSTPIVTDSDKSVQVSLNVAPISLEQDTVALNIIKSNDTSIRVDVHHPPITFVTCGGQGPPGAAGSGVGGVFVLDVVPAGSGIVSEKEYDNDTVPENAVVERAVTDTAIVRVIIGCNGGSNNYSPAATVAGVPVIFSETSTKRWFVGYADVSLEVGVNTLPVTSDTGGESQVIINRLGGGPSILSISFGAYPGTQTELKAGDILSVTITTELPATSITIYNQGATTGTNFAVIGGVATGNIIISSATGEQSIVAKAMNSFGTYGSDFISSTLLLNQTYPTFGAFSVTYPPGQQALKGSEQAQVSRVVSNFDTLSYTSPHLSIADPSSYSVTKTVTNIHNGYVNSGSNYTITANRAANNATASASGLVKIAATQATAGISISPSGRLVSSPAGIVYNVTITPSQVLLYAPTLEASLGTWVGSWTASGSNWVRGLLIADSTPRGSGLFSELSLTNLAGITSSTITSGANYTVGGFTLRTLTFPAFSRVALIGTSVLDETKTSAWSQGGVPLTRQTDTVSRSNGYYIADSLGNYNPTGSYMALSDTAIVGANTSGTLTASIQEIS
jgi:hypothetical protein